MSQTPVLSLPYIQPSQAQKHVTHNEALRILDAVVQLAVLDWESATPPVSPDEGARYIVGAAGQGDWTARDTQIAVFTDGTWVFVSPQEGWTAQVVGTQEALVFDGTTWLESGFDDLAGLGVNAQSDAVNRLSVSADATLLSHDGAGHQLKLNKAAPTDTASLLFQTGFSGRAEMGTTGSDGFAVKVSDDGATWFDAIVVDEQTGAVHFPNTPTRRVLTGPEVVYVDPISGSDSASGTGTGTDAFASVTRALEEVRTFDAAGNTVTIQLADGTHTLVSALQFERSVPGASEIVLRGNPATPTSVVLTAAEEVIEVTAGRLAVIGMRLENSSTSAPTLSALDQGHVTIADVDFGDAGAHIQVNRGALTVAGDYSISGDAKYHMRVKSGGVLQNFDHTITLGSVLDFSTGFILCQHLAYIKFSGVTISGTATGKRHLAAYNAILDTSNGGANFFPGDVAGTAENGGIFR